jgi:D-beta-D-heptose 7-phosphate kinase/D-beta-D-heptose 1-phosphate adenosyltransferase
MTPTAEPPPLESAAHWLDRLGKARVLVVGDAMIDCMITGSVERISPEAPIPVLRMEGRRAVAGGAGNVLANLQALGTRPHLVSVAGDDAAADQLAALLDAAGGAELIREPGRPTTTKTRYVAGGQQLLRVDDETARPVTAATASAVLAAVERRLAACDALVLSDYAKGLLADDTARRLIAMAQAAAVPVLVDPKGRDYRRYAGATVLTPNRHELALAAGRDVADEAALEATAAAFRTEIGVGWLLTTLGPDGMLLMGETTHRIRGIRREVFDVVGAGDTVIATMAAMLAAGADPAEAANLANLAGSVAVTRVGTVPVSDADLRMALARQRGAGHEAKLLSWPVAQRFAADARRHGARIGFTNGCFDILHPGHVSLISQARLRCDKLILGLNSDASIRRLKGPTRPVNDAHTRALVLAAIEGVDAVVEFDQDTPVDLIRALRPDLLVKGADYTLAQVVGADEVQSWGGEVYLAQLIPEMSTTATIGRMRGGT